MKNKIQSLPNGDFKVLPEEDPLVKVGTWLNDKGYEIGTEQEQQEFDKNRNYEWDNWKPIK